MRIPIPLQPHKVHYKNYFLLLVICLLAYWPLTFGVFSVKNDAIHYFLPYRFQIGETIRYGELPFWNPYIYLGYPIHGDMQSGAWNPIVWLFSFWGRYDITSFHFENLLYIFLGAVGMYKLTNRLTAHSHTALLLAVSYMLSGFMLSGQLINWLAAAAFLPFVLHYYLKTLSSASFANAVKTGLALYFLLVAGYPSFFIVTGYILLLLFILAIINRAKHKETLVVPWKKFILQHLLLVVVFTGLALPAIVSFIELLPYYQRGGGTGYNDVIQNSFEPQHLLSFLFPSAIKATDIVSATDVTCRNIYIGLFTLLLLASIPPKFNRRNILLLSLAIFAFLFSLGDATPIRKICYRIIPLMDTFRHPSQMRLFLLFALLLLAAPGLKKFLTGELSVIQLKRLKQLTVVLLIAFAAIAVIALFQSSFLKNISGFNFTAIKNFFDNTTLADAIAVNGIIQLTFLIIFFLLFKKSIHHKILFSALWVINLFVMAQLVLPSTFVGKTSPKEINALIHSFPKGFPVAGLDNSITTNSKDATADFDKIALRYFYNKKIGISRITNSPSFLNQQELFIQSNFLYNYVASLPVVYIADSIVRIKDTASILSGAGCKYAFTESVQPGGNTCPTNNNTAAITNMSANRFEIEADVTSPSLLVLTQNYHHYWKVSVDGKPATIYKTNVSFMGTALSTGKHRIVFCYCPSATLTAIWVMLATVILLLIVVAVSLVRQNRSSLK